MDNFDLKKYLAENRLFKKIEIDPNSEIANYIVGMFNSSVTDEEGEQSGIWRKEEYTSTAYDEGSVFMDLVNYLRSVDGSAMLEGNPDIVLELLPGDDIKWSADVRFDSAYL